MIGPNFFSYWSTFSAIALAILKITETGTRTLEVTTPGITVVLPSIRTSGYDENRKGANSKFEHADDVRGPR